MKRVLVTGASGFIGRHCLTALRKSGCEIHATSTRVCDQAGVHWHRLDLLQADATSALLAQLKPTHLLHLAWYAEPGKYWTAQENLSWIAATAKLLQAFAAHGGQRVVGAGSCAEYNWRYGLCTEQFTPCEPATFYGASKYSTHLMMDAWARQMGISAAWGRIFFLYGEDEHPSRLVRYVVESLLSGQPARCTEGTQQRDFLHVQDVAGAFVRLLDSDVTGAVNIGSGTAVAVRDLVGRIADRLGRRDLVQLGAIAGADKEPPLVYADVTRLRREVGYLPCFDLDSGIAWTIERLKQETQRKQGFTAT